MKGVPTGTRDTRVTFQRKSVVRDAAYGSESVSWVTYAQQWAKFSELYAYERVDTGVRSATRVIMLQCPYVDGLTTDMRVVRDHDGKVYQIIAVLEMARREGVEVRLEEYSA